jgi:hypothetical protein
MSVAMVMIFGIMGVVVGAVTVLLSVLLCMSFHFGGRNVTSVLPLGVEMGKQLLCSRSKHPLQVNLHIINCYSLTGIRSSTGYCVVECMHT